MSLYKRRALICNSFIENKLKFAFSNHCLLFCRTDVYRVWFAVALVHESKQVATIATDCIQLRWDILVPE